MNLQDDNLSCKSNSVRRTKECAICGVHEDQNWIRHWRIHHPDQVPKERDPAQPLEGDAYDKKLTQFTHGNKAGCHNHTKKRSQMRSFVEADLTDSLSYESAAYKRVKSSARSEINFSTRKADIDCNLNDLESIVYENCVDDHEEQESKKIQTCVIVEPIALFRSLQTKDDSTLSILIKVIEVADKFLSSQVLTYIKAANLKWFSDILIQIRPNPGMTDNQLLGLLLAMTVCNENSFSHIATFLSDLNTTERNNLLIQLQPALSSLFKNHETRRWIVENFKILDGSVLPLINFLENIQASNTYQRLQLCRVCTLPKELSLFSLIAGQFLSSKQSTWIEESLCRIPTQEKISWEQMSQLVYELTQSRRVHLLETNKQLFMTRPVSTWLNILNEVIASNSEALVCDLEVGDIIEELQTKFGRLDQQMLAQLYLHQNSCVTQVLKNVKAKPNQFQTAVSAYACTLLSKSKRQLWVLPSGTGKSRMIASLGLMFLLESNYKFVHVVTPCIQLARRDENEFADYWALGQIAGRIQYHDNLDFEIQPDSVVLIDEADYFAFGDVQKFQNAMAQAPIICFSATLSDCSEDSLESNLFDILSFSTMHFCPNNLKDTIKPHINSTLDNLSKQEFIEFILDKSKNCAVLIYTSDSTLKSFQQSQIVVNHVTIQTKHEELRNLDQRINNEYHQILIATDQLMMRGFDYRAPSKGIYLVIDKSFDSLRDAEQGLSRVGRFGDKCERVITNGTPLVDNIKSNEIKGSIIKYLSSMRSKTQVQPNQTDTSRKNAKIQKAQKEKKQTQEQQHSIAHFFGRRYKAE